MRISIVPAKPLYNAQISRSFKTVLIALGPPRQVLYLPKHHEEVIDRFIKVIR